MSGATETTYNLIEISIQGATDTYATDINNRGEIVGYTEPSSGLRQGQGFVYAQGSFNILPVPVLSVPLAINNVGEVVGGYVGQGGDDAAFLYKGGAVSELFSMQGFFGADAFLGAAGLNDDGIVAGNIYAQNNYRGFIYDHGISRSLRDDLRAAFPTNPPGMDITGDFRAITTDINNQGEVVGVYRAVQSDSDNSPRFGLVDYNGAVTLLQVPGAANTDAFGINDAGEIVGGSDVGAFIYENGNYTILTAPMAATGTTVAEDVNDQGDIIGNYTDAAGIRHGFVYRDGTYITLDGPGAVSTTLSDINSRGEIVGNYTSADGTNHAFLAMPRNDRAPTLIQAVLDCAIGEGQTLQGLYAQLLANVHEVDAGGQAQLTISYIGQSDTRGFIDFDPSDHRLIYTADGLNPKQSTDMFTYTVSDSHGGTVTGTVRVTVTGPNRPTQVGTSGEDTLTANGSGRRLVGGDGDDTLIAHGANQLIFGGLGDDNITANGAGSVIYGGPGTNTVTLHGNRAAVVLQEGGLDVISGFKLHGDVLDLKQVLAEEQIDLEGDVGRLAAYVTVSTSGQDATVSFNPDGAASGPGSALAVLHGIGPKVSLDALLHDGILIA